MNDLTMRQRSFVRHYVECGNATRAAKQAGYSAATAPQQGSRLLSKVNVQQALADELQAAAAATSDTPDGIVAELNDLGARAAQAGQYAPAVRAVELRGKALGMWQADSSTGRGTVTIQIFDSSVSFGDSHPGKEGLVIEGRAVADNDTSDGD